MNNCSWIFQNFWNTHVFVFEVCTTCNYFPFFTAFEFCQFMDQTFKILPWILLCPALYKAKWRFASFPSFCLYIQILVFLFQCNQDYFHEKFTLGVCLHACGVATDMVLKQCIENEAQFVICPCCYGGIQDTHFITYPRSQHFKNVGIEYKVGTAFWIQLQSLFLVNLFMYW